MNAGRKESHPIRDGIVQALRGAGGLFTETSEAVSRAVTDAVHEAGAIGDDAADRIRVIVESAVRAMDGAGEDAAGAIKGITVGVLHGARKGTGSAARLLSKTSGTIVRETIRQGGDLTHATQGLVRGAIHNAKEMGLDAAEVASDAADAALDAAESVSAAAAEKVRAAVEGSIDGVRVMLRRHGRNQDPPMT